MAIKTEREKLMFATIVVFSTEQRNLVKSQDTTDFYLGNNKIEHVMRTLLQYWVQTAV